MASVVSVFPVSTSQILPADIEAVNQTAAADAGPSIENINRATLPAKNQHDSACSDDLIDPESLVVDVASGIVGTSDADCAGAAAADSVQQLVVPDVVVATHTTPEDAVVNGAEPTEPLDTEEPSISSRASWIPESVKSSWKTSRKFWKSHSTVAHSCFVVLELVLLGWSYYQMSSQLHHAQKPLGHLLGTYENAVKKLTDEIHELRTQIRDNTVAAEQKSWDQFNTYIQRCFNATKLGIENPECESNLAKLGIAPPLAPKHFSSVTVKLDRRAGETGYPAITSTLTSVPTDLSIPVNYTLIHQPRESLMTNFLVGFVPLAVVLAFLIWKFVTPILEKISKTSQVPSNRYTTDDAGDQNDTDEASNATLESKDGFGAFGDQVTYTSSIETKHGNTMTHRNKGASKLNVWTAAHKDQVNEVERLLIEDEDLINKIDPRYGTPLTAAAEGGCKATVKLLLCKGADSHGIGGRFGTPLQAAAYSGKASIVELLVEGGADVDASSGTMGPPLTIAIEKRHAEIIPLLMGRYHANARRTGGPFGSALQAAVAKDLRDVAKQLLERGADVDCSHGENGTALQIACMTNNLEMVRLLFDWNADIECRDLVHGTPFQLACRHGFDELAKVLMLEHKANVNLRDEARKTPLHDAARLGKWQLAQLLVHAPGVDVNAIDDDCWTPLHHAAVYGFDRVIDILLRAGANVAAPDKFNAHALFRAAGLGHTECVRLLLQAGSPVDAADTFGRTALHGPPDGDDVSVPELLLAYGANVNAVGRDGKTALHEAAHTGNLMDVKLLLSQAGIRTSIQDNDQATPLQRAVTYCSSDPSAEHNSKNPNKYKAYEEIALLLLAQPDVDIDARSGSTFQLACVSGSRGVVKAMLEQGVKFNAQGGEYGSAVGAAAFFGHLELVQLLLEAGASPNIAGGEFGCPLQAAAFKGHVDVVRELVECGAELNAGGGRYWCALSAAAEAVERAGWPDKARMTEVERFLRDAGAVKVPIATEKDDHRGERWALTPGGWGWLPVGRS